jgi:hypothetical protein
MLTFIKTILSELFFKAKVKQNLLLKAIKLAETALRASSQQVKQYNADYC